MHFQQDLRDLFATMFPTRWDLVHSDVIDEGFLSYDNSVSTVAYWDVMCTSTFVSTNWMMEVSIAFYSLIEQL